MNYVLTANRIYQGCSIKKHFALQSKSKFVKRANEFQKKFTLLPFCPAGAAANCQLSLSLMTPVIVFTSGIIYLVMVTKK